MEARGGAVVPGGPARGVVNRMRRSGFRAHGRVSVSQRPERRRRAPRQRGRLQSAAQPLRPGEQGRSRGRARRSPRAQPRRAGSTPPAAAPRRARRLLEGCLLAAPLLGIGGSRLARRLLHDQRLLLISLGRQAAGARQSDRRPAPRRPSPRCAASVAPETAQRAVPHACSRRFRAHGAPPFARSR